MTCINILGSLFTGGDVPPSELDHKIRDAQCGLPGNKIGWWTAEPAAGQIHTTWARDWCEFCEVDLPRSQCRSPRERHPGSGKRFGTNLLAGDILLETTSGSCTWPV